VAPRAVARMLQNCDGHRKSKYLNLRVPRIWAA
jgi:hypothetical protein